MVLIDTIEDGTEIPDLDENSSDEDIEEDVDEKTVSKKKLSKVKVKSLPKSKKRVSEFSLDFKWVEEEEPTQNYNTFEDDVVRMAKGKARLADNTKEKLSALSKEVDNGNDSEDDEEHDGTLQTGKLYSQHIHAPFTFTRFTYTPLLLLLAASTPFTFTCSMYTPLLPLLAACTRPFYLYSQHVHAPSYFYWQHVHSG